MWRRNFLWLWLSAFVGWFFGRSASAVTDKTPPVPAELGASDVCLSGRCQIATGWLVIADTGVICDFRDAWIAYMQPIFRIDGSDIAGTARCMGCIGSLRGPSGAASRLLATLGDIAQPAAVDICIPDKTGYIVRQRCTGFLITAVREQTETEIIGARFVAFPSDIQVVAPQLRRAENAPTEKED